MIKSERHIWVMEVLYNSQLARHSNNNLAHNNIIIEIRQSREVWCISYLISINSEIGPLPELIDIGQQ